MKKLFFISLVFASCSVIPEEGNTPIVADTVIATDTIPVDSIAIDSVQVDTLSEQ